MSVTSHISDDEISNVTSIDSESESDIKHSEDGTERRIRCGVIVHSKQSSMESWGDGTLISVGENTVEVKFNNGNTKQLNRDDITPVPACKNDEVLITAGDLKGKQGTLIGIDEPENEGLVRIDGEVNVYSMDHVVRYNSKWK